MPRIPRMTPATINTILNTAPMIIQGAGKLIKLIREQPPASDENNTEQLSLESLQEDIDRLESRLTATDESNIEQIKLIEQLARQNELLAASIARLNQRINLVLILAISALLISVGVVVFFSTS